MKLFQLLLKIVFLLLFIYPNLVQVNSTLSANNNNNILEIPKSFDWMRELSYDISNKTGKVGMLLLGNYQYNANSSTFENSSLWYYELDPSTGKWSFEDVTPYTNITAFYRASISGARIVFDNLDQPQIIIQTVVFIDAAYPLVDCDKVGNSFKCPYQNIVWLSKENNVWRTKTIGIDNHIAYRISRISLFKDSKDNIHLMWLNNPSTYSPWKLVYLVKLEQNNFWSNVSIDTPNSCSNFDSFTISNSINDLYLICDSNLYYYKLSLPELKSQLESNGSFINFSSNSLFGTNELQMINDIPMITGINPNQYNKNIDGFSPAIILLKYNTKTESFENEPIYQFNFNFTRENIASYGSFASEIYPSVTAASNGTIFVVWKDLMGKIQLSKKSNQTPIWNQVEILGSTTSDSVFFPSIFYANGLLHLISFQNHTIYYDTSIIPVSKISNGTTSAPFNVLSSVLAVVLISLYVKKIRKNKK